MNREEIREKTMQLIYQMDVTGEFDYSKLNPVDEDADVLEQEQAIAVLDSVRDHITEIDNVIRTNLDRWSFERVARTDLAILRTAVAEMFYVESIPVGVSINEAVELAKKYGDERSFAFINSVLGKISRRMETEADKK
jgi:N utilization substance protein B